MADDFADVGIALVGDDAFGIVVQLFFAVGDMFFQMGLQRRLKVQLLKQLFVALEDFNGEPAQIALVDQAGDGLFNVCQRVLDAAGKDMRKLAALGTARQGDGFFGGFHTTFALQGAHLDNLAAERFTQAAKVDLVAVFANQIDHVDGDDNRNAELDELGGQVQVALDVGAVDDIQNGVGLFAHQVCARHDLFQRIGRQGIDARKILNDDIFMPFQAPFLFFDCDAGPVPDILAGAGQSVEQRRLSAVRIAGQRNFDFHGKIPPCILAEAN